MPVVLGPAWLDAMNAGLLAGMKELDQKDITAEPGARRFSRRYLPNIAVGLIFCLGRVNIERYRKRQATSVERGKSGKR